MNDKRLDSIPDVPTCQEAGYNVVLGTWRRVLVFRRILG